MIAFIPPTVDGALWLAGLTVALVLAVAHLVFLPGVFAHHELPRTVTYAIGLGTVLFGFTALYLFARGTVQPLQPILDLWFLAIAAALPTLGFRLMRDHLHLRDEVKNSGNN